MTHTLHELFGQLRSHLHVPGHLVAHHAKEIVALITRAVERDAERVSHEWRAYLEHAPHMPALTATSMQEFDALGVALPSHHIGLDLSGKDLEAPVLESLCTNEGMARVNALILDNCSLTRQDISALTSRASWDSLRSLSMSSSSLDADAIGVLCDAAHLDQLERLNLSHNDFDSRALEHLATTRALPSLTHLDISHKRKIDAESSHVILTTPVAAQLVELGINRCGLRGLTNELTQHTSLQALDISSNYMNDIDLSQFIAHPNSQGLRHLDLGHNSIGDKGLLMVLNACAHVHTLRMEKTRLTPLAADQLIRSEHTRTLRSLDLSRTRQHTSGALTLADGRFDTLDTLHMDECKLGFSGVMTLLASDALPALRWCSLSRNGASVVESIASRLRLLRGQKKSSVLWHERERLRREPATLNVQSNNLREAQIEELVEALHRRHFTHLDISDNPIGDRGLSRILGSLPGERLTHLTAVDVSIGELAALTSEGALPELEGVNLGGNPRLGDEAARCLGRWAGLGRLEELDLRACGLGVAGARAIMESEHLDASRVVLRFEHNVMSASERAHLQEIATERGIIHDLGEHGSV